MNTLRSIIRSTVVGLCGLGVAGGQTLPAIAAGVDEPYIVAAADCYAIGQQVAAQNGGTLAKASQADEGGQPVCVIVVLVPGKDGQRPRRMEIVVPAG